MKIIRFFSKPEYRGFADAKPAKSFIPQWYKDAEVSFKDNLGESHFGLKTCMPYLDALTSGYMLSTPVEIYINEEKNELGHLFNNNENSLQIRWDGADSFNDFINERPKQSGHTMPRPPGHYPNHLVFKGFWHMKTPRGYSLLMTQPLNRQDLPWTIASGIIDSDKYFAPGNIPFFMKKGITGVIPKGTPIAQLIPIKRESWTTFQDDPYLTDKNHIQGLMVQNKETNYKRGFWQRKKYD